MAGIHSAHTEPKNEKFSKATVGFASVAPAPWWLSWSPATSPLHRAQDSVQSLPVSLDLQGHWTGWTSGWAGTERQPTAEMSAICPGPAGVPSQTANIFIFTFEVSSCKLKRIQEGDLWNKVAFIFREYLLMLDKLIFSKVMWLLFGKLHAGIPDKGSFSKIHLKDVFDLSYWWFRVKISKLVSKLCLWKNVPTHNGLQLILRVLAPFWTHLRTQLYSDVL